MELRTGNGERPSRVFLPGGEEVVAIYAGNEMVWAKYRSSNVEVPRANFVLRAYTPSLYTESATVVSVPRAEFKIIGYAPTVRGDLAVNNLVPRANINIVGYAPTVRADRRVDITPPRANVVINGYTPTAVAGISATILPPRAGLVITAYTPSASAKRAVEITPPRANIVLSGYTPDVLAQRKVDIDPVRSNLVITGYAPTVEINERIDVVAPRSNMVIRAYAPADVLAQRAVEITPPRANMVISAMTPSVIGGISVNITPPRANMVINAPTPNIEVVSLIKQQINKVGRFAFASNTAIPVTGWASDSTNPANLVSDSILDVVGGGQATIKAFVRLGRNSTSGTPTAQLVINGNVVDSVDALPNSTAFGNTDPLRGRPCYLQWTGIINAGDDIRLDGIRTTSTTGYVNDGSTLSVEPGNKTFTMQRMYKNTSAYSLSTTQSTVTGWTADTKYNGSTVSSDRLSTSLVGTGTVSAYVVCNNGAAVADFRLMMNGVEIGSVSIPGGNQAGYWITVPNVTFSGSDLIWLTAARPDSSRSTENNSLVIEASIPNAA